MGIKTLIAPMFPIRPSSKPLHGLILQQILYKVHYRDKGPSPVNRNNEMEIRSANCKIPKNRMHQESIFTR